MGISKQKSKEIANKVIRVIEQVSTRLENKYAYFKLYEQDTKDNGKFETPEEDDTSWVNMFEG